jgi:hypothetical protein
VQRSAGPKPANRAVTTTAATNREKGVSCISDEIAHRLRATHADTNPKVYEIHPDEPQCREINPRWPENTIRNVPREERRRSLKNCQDSICQDTEQHLGDAA